MALAYAEGELSLGKTWRYDSIVSQFDLTGWNLSFGFPIEIVSISDGSSNVASNIGEHKGVIVKVSGTTSYVGAETFVCKRGNG